MKERPFFFELVEGRMGLDPTSISRSLSRIEALVEFARKLGIVQGCRCRDDSEPALDIRWRPA